QRYQPLHAAMPCLVNPTHAALADEIEHDVMAENQLAAASFRELLNLKSGQPVPAQQFLDESFGVGKPLLEFCGKKVALRRFEELTLIERLHQAGDGIDLHDGN